MAQLLEVRPRRPSLILHEGEVPSLGRSAKMIRRQPSVVRRRGVPAAEELLAVVELVQWVFQAVISQELQLVEAWGSLGTPTCRSVGQPGREPRPVGVRQTALKLRPGGHPRPTETGTHRCRHTGHLGRVGSPVGRSAARTTMMPARSLRATAGGVMAMAGRRCDGWGLPLKSVPRHQRVWRKPRTKLVALAAWTPKAPVVWLPAGMHTDR